MKNVYDELYGKPMPRRIKNQFQILTHGKDFEKLAYELREQIYKNKSDSIPPECERAIIRFLKTRKSPLSWTAPIFSFIKFIWLQDDLFTFPFNNNITLRVGSKDIIANNEIVLSQDKSGKLIDEENNISIVIRGKVSVEEILQFVRDHKKEIGDWQKRINLPEHSKNNWRSDIDLAEDIIRMKDKEKMTFTEISDSLSIRNASISDENSIKSIYYRFKKRLSIE